MSERLFFALWPSERQRRSLERLQQGLTVHRGRPVHPQDIHATLVFLGQVDGERRACVEHAAGRVAARGQAGPFELVLDRIGCFPRARVVWCGAEFCPGQLAELVSLLNGELEGCGLVPDRRPYRPHVTLFRKAAPLRADALDPPVRWPADSFVLAGAREGPPPRYRILRRWSLGKC